jgi:hypothetical protein
MEVMERASSLRHLLLSLLILPMNWDNFDPTVAGNLKDVTECKSSEFEPVIQVDLNGATRAFAVKNLLAVIVSEPFYVVSNKAQRRVPLPSGIELGEPFNERSILDFCREITIDCDNASSPTTQTLSLVYSKQQDYHGQKDTHFYEGSYSHEPEARNDYPSYNGPKTSFMQPPVKDNLKKDSLFYLRSNAISDVMPLSKVLLDTFEDPIAGRSGGKKLKKSKSNDRKNKSSVDVIEVMPAGAISSDEDAIPHRRNKTKKTFNKEVQCHCLNLSFDILMM